MKTKTFLMFLGTGGSKGMPVLGCCCRVCCSLNPKNRRLRASALLVSDEKYLLLDVGPDFRQQALLHDIRSLSGVLLTHAHFDHIGGIVDLRPLGEAARIPCLLSQMTFQELDQQYPYLSRCAPYGRRTGRWLDFQILSDLHGELTFAGAPICYVSYWQDDVQVNGFRWGSLAYLCDLHTYKEDMLCHLSGVDILVIGGVHATGTRSHLGVDAIIAVGREIGASQVFLTHLGHGLEHEQLSAQLPEGFFVAYDGMKIAFDPTD